MGMGINEMKPRIETSPPDEAGRPPLIFLSSSRRARLLESLRNSLSLFLRSAQPVTYYNIIRHEPRRRRREQQQS